MFSKRGWPERGLAPGDSKVAYGAPPLRFRVLVDYQAWPALLRDLPPHSRRGVGWAMLWGSGTLCMGIIGGWGEVLRKFFVPVCQTVLKALFCRVSRGTALAQERRNPVPVTHTPSAMCELFDDTGRAVLVAQTPGRWSSGEQKFDEGQPRGLPRAPAESKAGGFAAENLELSVFVPDASVALISAPATR